MSKLKLERVINSKPAQKVFGWALEHAPFTLPIKPLRQTSHWMAYNHPTPSYPIHILLVPRANLRDWMSVGSGDVDLQTTREFVELTQSIIREYGLTESGYRLILNGGSYQTFPHLHIHLVSGDVLTD